MDTAAPPPSRPLGKLRQGKLDRILATAEAHFVRQGFSGTTMDAVARDAGVGKATLYAHFPNKDGLFAAVIRREGERHSADLLAGDAGPAELPAVLLRFARSFLALLLSPETVAAHRSVAAEAYRVPELGRLFYESGPARALDRLAQFLDRAMRHGWLRNGPPHLAAAQFIGVIRADLQIRVTLGIDTAIAEAEREQVLAEGVAMFLRAYAPG